ncbi:SDR family oxidoreductase [Halomarina oriensis]|uniref:NAD-dependent epimerase/dehydratase family protein n=1 Tax=Halomarina oriensis TaxID=671145 RepID=A0A6B0GPL1_9EURY|nr:SDR family oxidoreductase [Halomarina oriensis]MWG36774.1 NAD-dependent epimerase/dehydratase family protein [Halomarina oriensis]
MTTVFLTGFPGFLGSALVERLLERHDTDTTVTCLVQSKYRDEAERRRETVTDDHDTGRVELVEGDITDSDLGLGDVYDEVQADTVEVYHLAAIYDLSMAREPGKAVNVEGTRHVVEFAAGAADLDRLHYVSTVVVSGTYEGEFTESMLLEGQRFANYYETTKHAAEVLVQQRMDEVPTTVYRPGVAVGDSETGATQKYDGPYAFLDILTRQGDTAVVPAPHGAGTSAFNLVPRDYVVDAIAYLSGIEESEGTVYHLADPDPPTTVELVKAFGEALGKSRTVVVPFPRGIVEGVLSSLVPDAEYLTSGSLHYQTWPTRYDCSNALTDLEGSGVEPPRFEEYVDALVAFYRDNPDVGEEGMN